VISAAPSRVKVLVIPTNEELVVAREVKRFLENPRSEVRGPKELRNPKSENTGRAGADFSAMTSRISNFLRTSDFGFRICSLSTLNHQR
jgi:hypothetical protein